MRRSLISVPIIIIGKLIRLILRLFSKGSGSAFPGMVVEKTSPKFISRMLKLMPYGVVVITGTNGKTTTSHIISQLFEGQGLKVFTNKSGSNFTRGIVSELLRQCSIFGNPQAQVAVLELDEAYGVHFIEKFKPKCVVLLNVMRDQLDRFGEIDTTASFLEKIAFSATDSVVFNREDPLIRQIDKKFSKDKTKFYFGVNPILRPIFLNDDELHSDQKVKPLPSQTLPSTFRAQQNFVKNNEVILENVLPNNEVLLSINGHQALCPLQLRGIHNIFNSTAAIACVRAVMKNELDGTKMLKSLSLVHTAFGRGETILLSNGVEVDLVLVKNPAGFRLAMMSFEPSQYSRIIAINDQYADGRDVSWLYDVDFNILKDQNSNNKYDVICTTGKRAYDMALRMQYQKLHIKSIIPNIEECINSQILKAPNNSKIRIYATYTAMLTIRSLLLKDKAI